MWADNFWIISHSQEHLEQMLKDLIEEAAKVYLEHTEHRKKRNKDE